MKYEASHNKIILIDDEVMVSTVLCLLSLAYDYSRPYIRLNEGNNTMLLKKSAKRKLIRNYLNYERETIFCDLIIAYKQINLLIVS